MLRACAAAIAAALLFAQSSGKQAFLEFEAWRKRPENASLKWEQSIERYEKKLIRDGLTSGEAARRMRIIIAHDEGVLYDEVYSKPPDFNTKPNALLVRAIEGRKPGAALDIAMGQGRNGLHLARKGWTVTGFDVSEVGLRSARAAAAKEGLKLNAVLASDEEFDFGRARWDLIALIYSLEKRSAARARDALKPGGLIVVEAGHKSASGAPFEYDTNELLKIFEGFRILFYEEAAGAADWSHKPIRLVRLIAQKPE